MPSSLADTLIAELLSSCAPFAFEREGENRFRMHAVESTLGRVTITAEEEALIVSIGGHTSCRFAVADYGHLRAALRPWSAVADAAEFLRELVALNS